MNRGPSLDDPVELARLVPRDELEELIDSIRQTLGCEIAVYGAGGQCLAGLPSAGEPTVPLEHEGLVIGRLAGAGAQAKAGLALACDTLGLLVHHSHACELAALTHEQAMQLTFGVLTEHNHRLSVRSPASRSSIA